MYVSIQYYHSPFGELILGDFEGKLVLCDWKYRKARNQVDNRIQKQVGAPFELNDTKLIQKAIKQLDEYFTKQRETFDLPLSLIGTSFQQSVWRKLIEIPFGETRSYLELSQELGDENAIRAVASANGANAISIIVPCHRIIGSDGSLTGYAGGLNAKKKLLELEGMQFGNQLSLFD